MYWIRLTTPEYGKFAWVIDPEGNKVEYGDRLPANKKGCRVACEFADLAFALERQRRLSNHSVTEERALL